MARLAYHKMPGEPTPAPGSHPLVQFVHPNNRSLRAFVDSDGTAMAIWSDVLAVANYGPKKYALLQTHFTAEEVRQATVSVRYAPRPEQRVYAVSLVATARVFCEHSRDPVRHEVAKWLGEVDKTLRDRAAELSPIPATPEAPL